MAFIRVKKRTVRWYHRGSSGSYQHIDGYYLVENRRVSGKVRQKVLLYLGPCDSVKSALMHFRQQAAYWTRRAQGYALRYLWTPRPADGRQWITGEEFKKVDAPLRADDKFTLQELKSDWVYQRDKQGHIRSVRPTYDKILAGSKKRAQKDQRKRCTKRVRQNTVAAKKCAKYLRKVKPDMSMAICNCRECQHARRCMWALETRLNADNPSRPLPAALGAVVPTTVLRGSEPLGTTDIYPDL